MPLGRVYIPPPTTPIKYGAEFSFPHHSPSNNKFSNKFNHISDSNDDEDDDFLIRSNNLKNKLNSETTNKPLNFKYNVDINGTSEEEIPKSHDSGKAFRKIEIKILDTKYYGDENENNPLQEAEICNGNVEDDMNGESKCNGIYDNYSVPTILDLEDSTKDGDEDKISLLSSNTYNNNINDRNDIDLQDDITDLGGKADKVNDCGTKTNDIVHRGVNNHYLKEENCQDLNYPLQKKNQDSNFNSLKTNQKNFPYNTKGLKNLGNTCYMNSIIQCLASTKPLVEFCLSFLDAQPTPATAINKIYTGSGENMVTGSAEKIKITKSFVKLLEDMWNFKGKTNGSSKSNHGISDPSNFRLCITKFAPKFSGFDQHDSQEFLQYALEGFHTELNRVKKEDEKVNEKTSKTLDSSNKDNNQTILNHSAVDSNCDSMNGDSDINNNENAMSLSQSCNGTDECVILKTNCDISSNEEYLTKNCKVRTYQEILDDKNLSGEEKGNQCLEVYLSKDNSFITDLFVGQFRSTLQCCVCHHESITFEPFWLISVPIPSNKDWKSDANRTVIDCMQEFTKTELLDGDEKPTCENCKERRKCKKWYSVERWPTILVIHLKRFSAAGGYRPKIGCIIDVTLKNLNFSMFSSSYRQKHERAVSNCDDIENEEDQEEEQEEEEFNLSNGDIDNKTNGFSNEDFSNAEDKVLYDCYAISNHSGTMGGGHYTAYCRHPFSETLGNEDDALENWNDSWHLYNDRFVNKTNADSVISGDAYLLFFEKT